MYEEIEEKLERLLKKCRCSKVAVVTVIGESPDTAQTNTFQLLDGDVVYFVACDGTAVLIDSGIGELAAPPAYESMAAATAALGLGKWFRYTAVNLDGAVSGTVAITQ